MTIMNVQLCIAVTYFYDYFEAKLVPSQIYSKLLKIAYGGFAPQPPQRGFASVPHWGIQAAPGPPASIE